MLYINYAPSFFFLLSRSAAKSSSIRGQDGAPFVLEDGCPVAVGNGNHEGTTQSLAELHGSGSSGAAGIRLSDEGRCSERFGTASTCIKNCLQKDNRWVDDLISLSDTQGCISLCLDVSDRTEVGVLHSIVGKHGSDKACFETIHPWNNPLLPVSIFACTHLTLQKGMMELATAASEDLQWQGNWRRVDTFKEVPWGKAWDIKRQGHKKVGSGCIETGFDSSLTEVKIWSNGDRMYK